MIYKTSYDSPLGSLLLLADEKGLTGLWFEKQKHFAYGRNRRRMRQAPLKLVGMGACYCCLKLSVS